MLTTGRGQPPAAEHRRGTGASSYLCTYCVQAWPCPAVEKATYGRDALADARADGDRLRARIQALAEEWAQSPTWALRVAVDDLRALLEES